MSGTSWLKKETDIWVHKGIISQDQAEQIIGLYPEDPKNRLISVLLILGAVLLGAGIILFFASNWQYLPRWSKVSLVIIPLVLFHLASHLTIQKYPRVSATLSLLGCIMFGSGIWLIAQIFHINAHFPNGILFWFLGVLPVALFLKEPLPLALNAVLLGVWVAAEHSSSPGVILVAVAGFAAVFFRTYTLRLPFALIAALISAVVFVVTESYLLLEKGNGSLDVAFLIPVALLLTGQVIQPLARHSLNDIPYFPLIYSSIGIVTTGIALFAMSFEYFAQGFASLHQEGRDIRSLWALFVLSTAVGVYLTGKGGTGVKDWLKENHLWLILLGVVLMILLAPVNELGLMITLNVLLFLWALSIMITGYQKQDGLNFTYGILAFSLFTITEYFNFFWRMLPKSLFFIVGGLVLILGGSFLERQRRKVIHSWTEVAGHETKS